MFETLGFTQTSRHRSGRVTRWSQNGINLLINNEPASFARAYADMHGASVCAMGVRIEDVHAAMERARALQISSFSQPVGPGELQIPAARGVGESLLYFIRDGEEQHVWKNDFLAVSDSTAGTRGVGLPHRLCDTDDGVRSHVVLAAVLPFSVRGVQDPAGRNR